MTTRISRVQKGIITTDREVYWPQFQPKITDWFKSGSGLVGQKNEETAAYLLHEHFSDKDLLVIYDAGQDEVLQSLDIDFVVSLGAASKLEKLSVSAKTLSTGGIMIINELMLFEMKLIDDPRSKCSHYVSVRTDASEGYLINKTKLLHLIENGIITGGGLVYSHSLNDLINNKTVIKLR